MTKPKATTHKRSQRPLTLKVAGQIRPGRIPIPELISICQHFQNAVNRQAAAIQGAPRTPGRPGPATDEVKVECTLELVGIRAGSPTAALGFDFAKPQQHLPNMPALGREAIARVAQSIELIGQGHADQVDRGVMDSLDKLGEVIDRGRVKEIRCLTASVPGKHKRFDVVFNKAIRRRVSAKTKPAVQRVVNVDGIVEMADFKTADQRCRIIQPIGPPVPCVFDDALSDRVYSVLRKPAQIRGLGTYTADGVLESVAITDVKPLEPLAVGAGHFFAGHSIEDLARLQQVQPLDDISDLAGGLPADEDVDAMLAEIYAKRV